MKTFWALAATAALVAVAAVRVTHTQGTPAGHTVSQEQLDKWKTELSNWGRWGKDDQKGTVNLITPAKRKQATSLVKEGITVSLEHPLLTDPAPDNGNPLTHTMKHWRKSCHRRLCDGQ